MDPSGAVTPEAIALNSERTTYEGGARLAQAHEERRMLILSTPADKFLDDEHLNDCINEVATWAPDVLRQKMLRKMAHDLARGHLLRPDEVAALRAGWRKSSGQP
jgi:hypothetical protein